MLTKLTESVVATKKKAVNVDLVLIINRPTIILLSLLFPLRRDDFRFVIIYYYYYYS